MSRAAVVVACVALSGCQPEVHAEAHKPVRPPVENAGAIPDAPLGGSLRGRSFAVKDARYQVDHRTGYEHVDIALSAGSSELPCGPIKPAGSPSVWLRLERSDAVASQELRLAPGQESPWSVHYQLRDGDVWVGSSEASAVLVLRASAGEGAVSGSLAVCFADDAGSCVSGSFDAQPCPITIDAPVRGAIPLEAVPDKYKPRLRAP